MLSYNYVHTIILGVALKPRDPDKDLKSILISELLMDKPPLLSWHSNQHIASLISCLSLTLHMGAGSHPSSLQEQRRTSRICQPTSSVSLPISMAWLLSSAPQSHPAPHCYSDGSHGHASKLVVSYSPSLSQGGQLD